MNIKLSTYISFSGDLDGLQPLLEDFGDALIKNGYGSDSDEEAETRSFIIVEESEYKEFDNTLVFIDSVLSRGYTIVVPVNEEDE